VDYVTRAAWGARDAESFTPIDPARLSGVTVHWYGSPTAAADEAATEAQLRAVQRAHQMGEFSDIAYNFVVSPWGRVYEGRGFRRQTGANGTTWANENHAAVCVAIGTGNVASAASKAAVARVIAAYRALGTGRDVKPHGHWTGSTCPGPDLRAWIAARGFETSAPAPEPEKEETVEAWIPGFVRWYLLDRRDSTRPKDAPATIPAVVWKLVDEVADVHLRLGPPAAFSAWRDWSLLDEGDRPASAPEAIPGKWWTAATADHAFANRYAEKATLALRTEVADLTAQLNAVGTRDSAREAKLRALLDEARALLAS
jgi:hypothetical protein